MTTYAYFINLDERGEFYADVRDLGGNTVIEIEGFEIFEDGYMKNKNDLAGLLDYMIELDIANDGDELVKGC